MSKFGKWLDDCLRAQTVNDQIEFVEFEPVAGTKAQPERDAALHPCTISLSREQLEHLSLIVRCAFVETSAMHMHLLQAKHGARHHLRGLSVPAADERIEAYGQEIARLRKLIERLGRVQ